MLAERQGRLHKVATIFEAFDADRDAKLNRAELTTLIQQCNPGVLFSEVQLDAITREVSDSGHCQESTQLPRDRRLALHQPKLTQSR